MGNMEKKKSKKKIKFYTIDKTMDCLQIIETAPKYGAHKENENKTKEPSLLEKK